MKKASALQTLLLPAALTLAAGAAAVLCNGWAASRALAANIPAELPASASSEAAGTEVPSEAARETTLETSRETSRGTTPPDENGAVTVVKTLDNGTTIFMQYVYDEKSPKADVEYDLGNGQREVYSYEGEAAAAMIERFGGPKRESLYSYTEGQPGENDISSAAAVTAAVSALTGKYALRQETLDRFKITTAFYSVYEDLAMPVWYVSLYPENTDDFSEIGCYTGLIDAETGEAARLLSAADGRG